MKNVEMWLCAATYFCNWYTTLHHVDFNLTLPEPNDQCDPRAFGKTDYMKNYFRFNIRIKASPIAFSQPSIWFWFIFRVSSLLIRIRAWSASFPPHLSIHIPFFLPWPTYLLVCSFFCCGLNFLHSHARWTFAWEEFTTIIQDFFRLYGLVSVKKRNFRVVMHMLVFSIAVHTPIKTCTTQLHTIRKSPNTTEWICMWPHWIVFKEIGALKANLSFQFLYNLSQIHFLTIPNT